MSLLNGSRGTSLKRDIVRMIGANGAFALSQWLALITVAQLGSARQVGIVTLATAIVTPIFAFSNLSLREARTIDPGGRFDATDYYFLRLATTAVAAVACVAIVLAARDIERQELTFAVLAYVVTKVFDVQTNLNSGVFQNVGRIDQVAKASYLRSIFGSAGFFIVFLIGRNVGWAFLGQATAWAVILYCYENPRLAELGQSRRWNALLRVKWSSLSGLFLWMLPLALAGAFQTLTSAIPRLALSHFADLRVLGYFGAIAYLQSASQLLTSAIGHAATKRLSLAFNAGCRASFVSLTAKLAYLNAVIGLMILLLAWLFGGPLLSTLYGPEYANMPLLLLVAATVALGFVTSIFQFAISAGQFFGLRLLISFSTFLLACLLSVLLIPSTGLIGAGWVLLSCSAVRLVLSVGAWRRIATRLS